jgi:peptidoglycan/LPS O-acetylase OafA/YrhL
MNRSEEHIAFLDHLRGLAILSVFLFHSYGVVFAYHTSWLLWTAGTNNHAVLASFLAYFPATVGWIGVPIFFVVSGFCIHLSHQRSRQKGFKVFFLRRFFRIYPPYLVMLLFFAFIFPATRLDFTPAGHQAMQSVKQVVGHLFLVHTFGNSLQFGIVGAFWSIAAEVQLYLLYPLLLLLTARLGWQRTLWITALIELGMRGFSDGMGYLVPAYTFHPWYLRSPLIFWFSWSIGAALADAYLKGTALPFRKFPLAFWPAMVILACLLKPFAAFDFTFAALATACFVSYLLSRPSLSFPTSGIGAFVLNHLRWVGVISYSAYLIHQPLLALWRSFLPGIYAGLFNWHDVPSYVLYLSCLPSWFLIVGLAYLSYRYIEMPSIAWGKRVIQKSQGSTVPPIVTAQTVA